MTKMVSPFSSQIWSPSTSDVAATDLVTADYENNKDDGMTTDDMIQLAHAAWSQAGGKPLCPQQQHKQSLKFIH